MLSIVLWSLAISIGLNGALFIIAYRLQSDKLTDASYALSFITLATFTFVQSSRNLHTVIGAILVCVWALRIGSFLLYRVLKVGSDKRFDGMRENFWRFGKFWLGQGLTVWVLMIPLTLASAKTGRLTALAYSGISIWLVGFLVESIADLQKYQFTHNPTNRNRWIDVGVWHYSRHPNYFGEILVWVGLYCFAAPVLSVANQIVSLVSPLFITALLLFVSGIPILEKSADKRWGSEPAYQTYKRRTSLLIPLPKQK